MSGAALGKFSWSEVRSTHLVISTAAPPSKSGMKIVRRQIATIHLHGAPRKTTLIRVSHAMTIYHFNSVSLRPVGTLTRFRSHQAHWVTRKTLISRHFSYDHVVIGGGVVGLAVAAKLAQ